MIMQVPAKVRILHFCLTCTDGSTTAEQVAMETESHSTFERRYRTVKPAHHTNIHEPTGAQRMLR